MLFSFLKISGNADCADCSANCVVCHENKTAIALINCILVSTLNINLVSKFTLILNCSSDYSTRIIATLINIVEAIRK